MASSTLNILSGIAAAAAGLSGEKVSKDGKIPGFDIAELIPAMLGKSGGDGGILGSALATVKKTGLLENSKLGSLADMAGSLLSVEKTGTAKKTAGGIEGLAAAIAGNSGKAAAVVAIAKLAVTLAKSIKDKKGLKDTATELGKTLAGSFGISFLGGGTALKALDKVVGSDVKGELFKAILKGLS